MNKMKNDFRILLPLLVDHLLQIKTMELQYKLFLEKLQLNSKHQNEVVLVEEKIHTARSASRGIASAPMNDNMNHE